MSFDAPIVTLAWLVSFELPARTLRFSDGGQAKWGADMYRASDDEFGTIEKAEVPEEKLGDDAAGATLTFLPASTTAASTLSSAEMQGAPVRVWLAEIDPATGEVVGDPELQGLLALDTTTLVLGRNSRKLEMGLVDGAERLFLVNEGNTLSSAFHQRVWPGELGFDNATGKPVTVPWGTTAPPRGTVATGGGVGGGGRAQFQVALA